MAQGTYIARKGQDADFANVTASGTLTATGAQTFTGAATFQSTVSVDAVAGVKTFGPFVELTETVAYDDFTDGGSTVGTYDLTVGTIPIGAYFLGAKVHAVVGFANDTSAVLTIGDGTDVDRYNTSTVDIFSTAANGVSAGIPSGDVYHDVAATVKLTVTTAANFTSVNAGSVTIKLLYWKL